MKSIEEQFKDWEGSVFGYGYGSGEEHTIPALRRFMELVPKEEGYDYRDLERELTPTVTWILIGLLCRADILTYGTSPRFAWLTDEGKSLQDFLLARTNEQLVDIVCSEYVDDGGPCYPDACNCGPNGYEKGLVCHNVFWRGHSKEIQGHIIANELSHACR